MQKIRGNEISMIFQDPMTSLIQRQKLANKSWRRILTHNKNMSRKRCVRNGHWRRLNW